MPRARPAALAGWGVISGRGAATPRCRRAAIWTRGASCPRLPWQLTQQLLRNADDVAHERD